MADISTSSDSGYKVLLKRESMSRLFEEIDYQPTPMGPISLRRRRELRLDVDVLEIMLGNKHLMSDLFTTSEIALAQKGLGAVSQNEPLSVVVGGLGMGYTAAAALEDPRVERVLVIEKLSPVIHWHENGLIPLGEQLAGDSRVQFILGDFFRMADSTDGFDPSYAGQQFHAILLDIDHTPNLHLSASHASFYQPAGLRRLARHLRPKGIFALWSNQRPDNDFLLRLQSVFAAASAVEIPFHNSLQNREFIQSIYVAQRLV